jgi:aspartyl-tRNA synthetase
MMLLGQESIRDVILFPQLRPRQPQTAAGTDLPTAAAGPTG